MNIITLDTSTQMLFALLRASLHEHAAEITYFENASDEDWEKCYRLAVAQGVMALAWDGIVSLPYELHPPKRLKLKWATCVEAYERKYSHYCSTLDEVSRFYAEHGICTLQLKGVGFSTLYPVPCHREGGDIDIYTYSAEKKKLSDKDANMLADKLMIQQGIEVDCSHSYKHSNFFYKGIPFENHKTFLNIRDNKTSKELDRLLQELMKPQPVSLVQGEVLIPSSEFNTLFIAFHAAQHFGNGLALHHLCDWAIILRRYGLQIPEGIKDKKFLSAIEAFTYLCNRYLGSSQKIDGREKIADEILSEILYPRYTQKIPKNSKLGIFVYKTRRFLYAHMLKGKIMETSFIARTWASIVCHLRITKIIFKR